jgi:dienelactone hydrolase
MLRIALYGGLLTAAAAVAQVSVSDPPAARSAPVAPAPAAALPPLETFFGPAKLQGASLSPDGRWLAALTGAQDRRVGLQILDLDGSEPPRFIEASPTDDISWFRWVDSDWLVFTAQDAKPQRNVYRGPGLMAVRRDGSASRQLLGRSLDEAGSLLSLGAPGSTEVIVAYSQSNLRAIDVVTGKRRLFADDAPRAGLWWFDSQGRARVASRRDGAAHIVWWADRAEKPGVADKWREIARLPLLESGFSPAFVEGEDTLVVFTTDDQGYLELRRFDFEAGRPAQGPPLLRTPGFDGGVQALLRRGSGQLDALTVELEAPTTVWLDPGKQALQDKVDARFPGRVNRMQAEPQDQPRTVLVRSYTDTDPGQWLVYRPQQDRWQLLGAQRPEVDPRQMGRLSFHRTPARDGRDLPLWITRPTAQGDQPGPAVVLVHGGPHQRGSSWRWQAEAQFLASRGYVVVQPEFRGSTGYGDLHFRAGWKQWGLAMQDDISDALHFAVAQGLVDPKRVCIMGASYGGYATLMGLAKDPLQYRCGVAFAAVSDPLFRYQFHWSDLTPAGREIVLPAMLGDPKADAGILAAGSPLAQVQRIQAPLLLAHGDDDFRVPLENGERMVEALKKHGKPVEWVLYVDEGHGLVQQKNVLDWYRRVEAFLAQHLK